MNGAEDLKLRQLLEHYRNRQFYFVRAGGNWGDHLIWAGAEHLAADLHLTFSTLLYEDFMGANLGDDSVVYLHGGGGFNSFASGRALEVLKRALETHVGPVIQGPQTVEVGTDYEALISNGLSISPKATHLYFFARERETADFLSRLDRSWLTTSLDSDTALHLSREAFIQRAAVSSQTYKLFALREDNERSCDISSTAFLPGVVLDPARYASSFEHWLRIHACASAIVTDRTHSAVAGAILGKVTTMLAGAYHKNRSIWEYSLKERGVLWANPDDKCVFPTSGKLELLKRTIPRIVRNSHKVKRLRDRWNGVPPC